MTASTDPLKTRLSCTKDRPMPSSGKFSDRLNWDHPDAIRTLERVAIRGTGKVGNPERCPNCNAIVRVLGVRQEH